VLKADHLSRFFDVRGNRIGALIDINLTILPGEFVAVTGPSGSGKSTLLLALGGMDSPTRGEVLWEDDRIYGWDNRTRARWRSRTVGFVFQSFNLVSYLTVLENVLLPFSIAGEKNHSSDTLERARGLLRDLGLSDRFDHFPGELSVGQQQRTAIARALAKNPGMILADEPTGNLDPDSAGEVMKIFEKLHQEGKTIIYITHDPNLASHAGRKIRIVDGKIAENVCVSR